MLLLWGGWDNSLAKWSTFSFHIGDPYLYSFECPLPGCE